MQVVAGLRQASSRRLALVALQLFAGMHVRTFADALRWYEQLLGEPSFFAHDTEAVWILAEGRAIYAYEDPSRAGGCAATVLVDNLEAWVAAIAGRGLNPSERETYSNGVQKVIYRDPDGNEVGFAALPRDEVGPADAER